MPSEEVEKILDAMAPRDDEDSLLATKLKAEQHIKQALHEKQRHDNYAVSAMQAGLAGEAKSSSWNFTVSQPQQPTVSRTVHYFDPYFPTKPLTAFITDVHSHTVVDLAVIDPTQPQSPLVIKTGVHLGSGDNISGCWMWPPRV